MTLSEPGLSMHKEAQVISLPRILFFPFSWQSNDLQPSQETRTISHPPSILQMDSWSAPSMTSHISCTYIS